MAAGKVYELEAQMKQLQSQVEAVDDEMSPWEMSKLESQVANAVANVASNEQEVSSSSTPYHALHHAYLNMSLLLAT